MTIKPFTQNGIITPIIEKAKKLKSDGVHFSDIVDEKGNLYVDMVQEGSGVLGNALAGILIINSKHLVL